MPGSLLNNAWNDPRSDWQGIPVWKSWHEKVGKTHVVNGCSLLFNGKPMSIYVHHFPLKSREHPLTVINPSLSLIGLISGDPLGFSNPAFRCVHLCQSHWELPLLSSLAISSMRPPAKHSFHNHKKPSVFQRYLTSPYFIIFPRRISAVILQKTCGPNTRSCVASFPGTKRWKPPAHCARCWRTVSTSAPRWRFIAGKIPPEMEVFSLGKSSINGGLWRRHDF